MSGANTAFQDNKSLIWYDGKMVPWKEANCHVLTHSLHYGAAVFEGERAFNGKIFKSKEHTERLLKSANLVGYSIPYSFEEIEEAKERTLRENNLKDVYLRAVAWRGSEEMGLGATKCKIHLAVAAWDWPSYFEADKLNKGLRLKIAKWRRPSPETAPSAAKTSGLYMICTMSKHEAAASGFDDALMLDYRGRVAECTAANVFLVFDGELHTPTPDCFLNGITRQTVMQLAKDRGLKVVERAILPEEMAKATECFVTGSAAGIVPVGEIDSYKFTVGDITRNLTADYIKATGQK